MLTSTQSKIASRSSRGTRPRFSEKEQLLNILEFVSTTEETQIGMIYINTLNSLFFSLQAKQTNELQCKIPIQANWSLHQHRRQPREKMTMNLKENLTTRKKVASFRWTSLCQLGLPEVKVFNDSRKLTIEVKVFNSLFLQFSIEVKVFNSRDFAQKTLFFYFFKTWYLLIFLIL